MPKPAAPPRPRRIRKGWRIALGAVGSLVLAVVLLVGFTLWQVSDSYDEVATLAKPFAPDAAPIEAGPSDPASATPTPPPATEPAPQGMRAQNILLLGSDTRGKNGTSVVDLTGQRSDTIMVVHVSADRESVYVMSILRDSWLDIPGRGQAKINAALAYGGVPLAVQTIEMLLGVPMDHVAIVDFAGFAGVTDALGGVTINNAVEFPSSKLPGHTFVQGEQHLDGEQALAYVRERYAFNDGDFQRVRNQQTLIKGMLSDVLSTKTFTDPGRLDRLVNSLTPFLAVDDGLSSAYLGGLALELRNVRGDNVAFFTMPTNGTGTSADGQSIVNIGWDRMPALQQGFQSDDLTEVAASLQYGGN